jgi:ubiquinol-cytochrome c reductase cytochrome c1 subunit
MPAPLTGDGQVTYSDGTPATVDQMSGRFRVPDLDAEPKLDKRKQTGWAVLGFLLAATVLAYLSKKQVWSNVGGH